MFTCWLLGMKNLLCGIKVCGQVICVFRLPDSVLFIIFRLIALVLCRGFMGQKSLHRVLFEVRLWRFIFEDISAEV